jgi:DNA-binding transcriptional ArsR family regulator
VDDVFAILADPTRRRMLDVLRRGERSVSELVDEVDIHQPGVSRHLRILHEAGLVSVRREAQRRIYSIRPEPLREVDEWLSHYRSLWDARFDKLAAHLERQKKEVK